ncbi:hypothetical protein OLMES_1607 [Oleiphilus messinensis]|uniref:LUD domain-containing protein n=1 Tax=Oleiphilus messinensis TaxID=141451 RepID=A0A1Y0I5D2_9GAMM|nr:lactate utilization protein [Oleiphilus messinensis]ARU55682.1 hypothetical protein OLMES_1607 [Oleiphilus messinensis]
MTSAKQNILARLKAAQTRQHRNSALDQAGVNQIAANRIKETSRAYTETDRLNKFTTALQASHAEVIDCTKDEWPKMLIGLIETRKLTHWLYSEKTETGRRFSQDVCTALPALEAIPYSTPVEQLKETLFNQIDAAITEAHGAIAETGTLVIIPGPEEPRLMSLVPPVHVVLLRKSKIIDTFDQLLEQENWSEAGLPTNVLLISGPSKTADIQQTLAYGAHGPKSLIVILI